MEAIRFSFVLLFVFGFLCSANSNPITSLFGKSDDKAEAETDEKATVTTTTTAKAAGDVTTTTTTATPEPSSSCGGLKGFLHMCDKAEPTEPPKNIKTRSVQEEDESDSDSDEDSKEVEEEKQETETSSAVSEPTEGVAKRQAEDVEAPILGEVPPMVGDAIAPPAEPSESDAEDDGKVEKRQAEDSNSSSDSDEDDTDEVMEVTESHRRRRDCRDGDGDYGKNCRRKREFVPTCNHKLCKGDTTESQ